VELPYYDPSANALFGAIVYMVTYATVSFKADEEKFRQSAERSPEWTHWAVGAGVLIVLGLLLGVFDSQVDEASKGLRTITPNDVPRSAQDVFAAVVGAYVEVAPWGATLGFVAGTVKGLYERGRAGVI
jgi:protein-S-isoprenylcysteine O-methyltransferase Ste14